MKPLLLCALGATLHAASIAFPEDARITNVRDLGAVGDGVTDDTAALRAAIQKTGLIYLPNGTYLVSEPLKVPPREGSAPARRILQGESRDGVVIRLADHSPAFADAAKPVPVFQISWGVAQAFRNGVRDLTFDVGAGNPGAIGCAFMASNQGAMHRVTLRAGEGSGAIGVELAVGDNGPLLLNDLAIHGFATGINTRYGQSMTFEHILIDGARIGIDNEHALLFMRGLRITASELGLRSSGHGVSALLEARIDGGGVAVGPNEGAIFVRDLDASGCNQAIAGVGTGPVVSEWANQQHRLLAPTEAGSLRLPIEETPQLPWSDPATWRALDAGEPVSVEHEGKAIENWLPSLQAQLDAGAETVYLRRRGLDLRGETRVPASLRRVIGCETELGKQTAWTVVVDEASTEPLVIERIDMIYAPTEIVLRAPRPVVLSSLCLNRVTVEPGAGPLFIEDCVLKRLELAPGTSCWARQINMEYVKPYEVHAVNQGGDFWCFGFKNEGDATMVETMAGGRSEIYAYVLANKATPSREKPDMFRVRDGAMSLVLGEQVGRQQPYHVLCAATIGTDSAQLTRETTARRANGGSSIGLLVVGDSAAER